LVTRLYDGLVDLLAYAAVVLLFAVMIGIGIDVASRYLLDTPVGWVYEFVQHSMLLILFFGLPWLTRKREHVSVDIVVNAVRPEIRRAMLVAGGVLSALVCAHLAYWASRSALDNFSRNVLTDGIYPIPRGALIAVIALGLAMTAVELLRAAAAMLRDPGLANRAADAELEAFAGDEVPGKTPR